jgi:organic hydroperoxide reductase OsmC/OhrA
VTHHYEAELRWSGSTGLGWEHYDRSHRGGAPPAEQELALTTGESKGDPRELNPEQLLVMAASSCQLLWFLHLAAKARIDVVEYEDRATGVMPTDVEPTSVTEIVLRPRIVVGSEASEDRVRKLVQTAHEHCYIANSLKSDVSIEAEIERR